MGIVLFMVHIDIQKLIQLKLETYPKSLEHSPFNLRLTPANGQTLFDDMEKLIRNFITVFIESKSESVYFDFPNLNATQIAKWF